MKKEDLESLKEADLYSMAMFTLYKLVDIPDYATSCELPYVLDKTNMLRLCQYFGGTTIKVPTIKELKSLMQLIILYKSVKIDGMPYKEAIEKIGYESSQLRKVKSSYLKMCKILDKYEFKIRKTYGE